MSRICPLFSGSTGNSTYIGIKNGGILVDVGASLKGLTAAIEQAGGSMDEIKAVAVTHEHIDHVKGLKAFINKTSASVIASEKTVEALAENGNLPENAHIILADKGDVEINGIVLSRFATSHDCEGSSGYVLYLPDGKKVSVCTDLGVVTEDVRKAIANSDLTVIESNHDVEMLKHGPYPAVLKMRIMGEKGHISNVACAYELKVLLQSGTTRFILGHLSQKNNTPLIARSCAEAALMDLGAQNGKDYILTVASPKGNGVTVI